MTSAAASAASTGSQPTPAWEDDLLLLAVAEGVHAKATPAQRQTGQAAFQLFWEHWSRPMERLVEAWCAFPPALFVGADAVLQELWRKVYFRAETFDGQGLTGTSLDRRVCAWLKQIARNVLRDEVAEYDQRKLCDITDEILAAIADRDPAEVLDGRADTPASDPRLAAIITCLQRLTEREIDVLRTTADYFSADQVTTAMPKHLSDALCARYRIPQGTLRQVRKRAKDRLAACAAPKIAALASEA
jgi:DNA-directed RNA polymerase specialized sigma24 family protein